MCGRPSSQPRIREHRAEELIAWRRATALASLRNPTSRRSRPPPRRPRPRRNEEMLAKSAMSVILDFCATPLFTRNYSLTIWAPSKEHCANYERCVTKQSRILPMKTMLISATSAVFLFRNGFRPRSSHKPRCHTCFRPRGSHKSRCHTSWGKHSRTSHSAIKQRERRPMRDEVYHDDKQRREEDHS